MPDYRRAHVPGGTFFFTLVTEGRAPILCDERARTLLRQALHDCRRRWPFRTEAVVLLPDHLHAIWSLPRGDTDYSTRWAWIKKEFTRRWLVDGGIERSVCASRRRNRRRGVWQRRFWEHAVDGDDDFEAHMDYIHYNPVKHGLTKCPSDWPYSSLHHYINLGWYPPDWGCASLPGSKMDTLDDTVRESPVPQSRTSS